MFSVLIANSCFLCLVPDALYFSLLPDAQDYFHSSSFISNTGPSLADALHLSLRVSTAQPKQAPTPQAIFS